MRPALALTASILGDAFADRDRDNLESINFTWIEYEQKESQSFIPLKYTDRYTGWSDQETDEA